VIHIYEGVQNLSAISTVNSIMKNTARLKEHVTGMAMLRSTAITKKYEGAIRVITAYIKT
jgi:hypothetical protein